jgi:alpha-N-arabinofuranosidase
VTADYTSGPHDGFVDFYAAMKAADPTIDVCATWAPITAETGLGGETLPELLAAEGHGEDYDCLVVHPYTNFRRDFGDTVEYPQQMHDWHMLGEAQATETLQHYADAVAEHRGDEAYVTTSELGALFFGANDSRQYRSWNTAMSHATYFASQWTRLAELGVPWAEGNTLVSEARNGLRAVLGGEPEFVETSEAVVRRALRPMVEGGGHVVRNRVQENPSQQTEPTDLGSSYAALATTATVDADGTLNILVVNRDPGDDVLAKVVPAGYPHAATATVSRVLGSNDDPNRASFESHNAISHPDEVRLTTAQEAVGQSDFAFEFPKHSVTLIRLSPRT